MYSPIAYPAFTMGLILKVGPDRGGQHGGAADTYEAHNEDGTWTITNSSINSTNRQTWDFSACVDETSTKIIFGRATLEEQNTQLYLANRDGDRWSEPQKLPEPVNSICQDDNPHFANNGLSIFYDSNRAVDHPQGQQDCLSEKNGPHRKILITRFQDGVWTDPVDVTGPFEEGDLHWQPFPAYDENSLYWSARASDCAGHMCLYRADRQTDGTYGNRILIADATPTEDARPGKDAIGIGEPTITADGKLLYFVYAVKYDAIYWDLSIGVARRLDS